jgi:hypothetical protein
MARWAWDSTALQVGSKILSAAVVWSLVVVMGPFLLVGRRIHTWECFRHTVLVNAPGRVTLEYGAGRMPLRISAAVPASRTNTFVA